MAAVFCQLNRMPNQWWLLRKMETPTCDLCLAAGQEAGAGDPGECPVLFIFYGVPWQQLRGAPALALLASSGLCGVRQAQHARGVPCDFHCCNHCILGQQQLVVVLLWRWLPLHGCHLLVLC
jgi:hypothetical protein